MIDLKKAQKDIYKNKIEKGFNVTNIEKEFCLIYGELSEAYDAYNKKRDDVGEELADVTIYILGLCEILGYNLEEEIREKMEKNSARVYKEIDGVKVRIKD